MRISDWSSDVCSSDLKEAISGISVEQQRKCTKKIFTDWIRHVARASGLLLLFEDEQWADLTSRELLEEIVESLKSIPALILVSVQIGRAHVWTPVTNAQLVYRLLLEKKKKQ